MAIDPKTPAEWAAAYQTALEEEGARTRRERLQEFFAITGRRSTLVDHESYSARRRGIALADEASRREERSIAVALGAGERGKT